MSALVEIEGLVIELDDGRRLVHDVDLRIPRGGSLGIVGESGSGKTLTCRALLGILPDGVRVSAGSIRFEGADLTDLSEREWRALWGRRLGAVFQDPASYLNPSIPVGAQLAESLRVAGGLTRRDARRRSVELFASVGLRDPERVRRSYVHELSGGMLQRVLIAIAIGNGPDVLVADEATTALDVTVQAEVLDLIAELREQRRLTLVLVSHDLAVVAQMCEELVVFKDGEIVERGHTREVLRAPAHPYTQHLLASQERSGIERLEALR